MDSFPQAEDLKKELERTVKGEVRFDRGSRALYSSDASNYRQFPIGLVVPRDEEDVLATIAACRKFGAPVLPRGAGTSLAGQTCNVAVVLDFTKYMHQILEINPTEGFARVQPGVVLDTLRQKAEENRQTFGPDPATHNRCTLGGMIGNNSCGTHSLLAGKTVDNVLELRVLLYDGTPMTLRKVANEAELDSLIAAGGRSGGIYSRLKTIRNQYGALIRERFPQIPRRVSGYNLDQLLPENGFHVARALVGTEGTCVTTLEAKVKLIRSPQHRTLVGLGYPDVFSAADRVPDVLLFKPIGLEGFDGVIVDGLRKKDVPHYDLLPDGRGILLVEFGSDIPGESEEVARRMIDHLSQTNFRPIARLYAPDEARHVWKLRESGPRAAAAVPGALPEWEGWDDASVAPEKLGSYLRDIHELLKKYEYRTATYGHFGDGCVHMRITFDLQSEAGIRKYAEFIERASDTVLKYGGSLSGEHGDGQSRAALLPKMFGNELMKAFGEFKAVWDPDNKMNPGKVVHAYLPTENLRLGADYKPQNETTYFQYPDDDGSLAKATGRCIGIGECRKQDHGSMCPSYMVTLEENHSTRGRVHMLFELLQGEIVRDGWRDEHVKKALDLCLACKACKSECPANVDVATYKAEFLAHYFKHKKRPLSAHAFGRIDRWVSIGSHFARITNFLNRAPISGSILKHVLDIAPQRAVPALATRSFKSRFRRNGNSVYGSRQKNRSAAAPGRSEVILWADTFNTYFHPETAQAALDVLEDAGFQVWVPMAHLCCGRPLYDFGFLDKAKEYLLKIMNTLAAEIDRGLPIVVLEPSCASVFRDELQNLFPKDIRAQRLRNQTFLLGEFLERRAPGYKPPQLSRKALLHGHCHQKSVLSMADEESLLRKMGIDFETIDSGCCGMAGPFGFEKDKYEVSIAVGERRLLPAVRKTPAEALIVTNGFSCREQVFQSTGRWPLHLAEVLDLANRQKTGVTQRVGIESPDGTAGEGN